MIYVIDQIKQKNDGDFYIVDAADVKYNDTSLQEALDEFNSESGSTIVDIATDDEVTEMLDEVFSATTN